MKRNQRTVFLWCQAVFLFRLGVTWQVQVSNGLGSTTVSLCHVPQGSVLITPASAFHTCPGWLFLPAASPLFYLPLNCSIQVTTVSHINSLPWFPFGVRWCHPRWGIELLLLGYSRWQLPFHLCTIQRTLTAISSLLRGFCLPLDTWFPVVLWPGAQQKWKLDKI